ncbi:MAG: hypothetical protein ACI89X_000856 [Planctomycetota bacterium]|jgi:hypothetical protein
MKKTVAVAVALSFLGLTMLASCGAIAGTPDVSGIYALDKTALKASFMAQMPADTPADGTEEAAAVKMVSLMADSMDGTIALKPDNSFVLSMATMGQKAEFVGSWKFEGDRLAITAKDGDDEEETRLADFANGTITIEEESGGKMMPMWPMRFTRLTK